MFIDIYKKWGFRENFLSHHPLGADEKGRNLIAGRDNDITKLKNRIKQGGSGICIDGPVGSGKTSLANVASYSCMLDYIKHPKDNPIIITCDKQLQLDRKTDEQIKREVFLNLAQTLIKNKELIKSKFPEISKINQWINTPLFFSIESQFLGFGAGKGDTPNESVGFIESGFPERVMQILESIFPDNDSGGIVYIIDNLELLESSKDALTKIESLRDSLFNLKGVRWILCGAYGILPGIIQSPRLEGCLGSTLKVNKISHSSSREIFTKRIDFFKDHTKEKLYTPIDSEDFYSLYMTLGRNLRSTLKTSSEYITYLSEEGIEPQDLESKKNKFDSWLVEHAISQSADIQRHLTKKPIEVLDQAIKLFDGEFTQQNFTELGFKTAAALRPHLLVLESHGLINSSRDEEDKRRLTMSVTGRGWLLNWARLKTGLTT